ncbi:MAG: DUF4276 family protein [Planctomycetes bacterium]|nr:DUF4276 family protein [Planctomycetota bacterium]
MIALVEGETELTFIREVLAPELGMKGLDLSARMAKPYGHGGVPKWSAFKPELLSLLKSDPTVYITMMIDFYGMPDDWPGRVESKRLPYPESVELIESEILAQISAAIGEDFNPDRLIPYVQCHEYEALLFSDPETVGNYLDQSEVTTGMAKIVSECGAPEEINDDSKTAPSKRIVTLINDYDKIIHGSVLALEIGISKLRNQCPHFNSWVRKLESLTTQEQQ